MDNRPMAQRASDVEYVPTRRCRPRCSRPPGSTRTMLFMTSGAGTAARHHRREIVRRPRGRVDIDPERIRESSENAKKAGVK